MFKKGVKVSLGRRRGRGATEEVRAAAGSPPAASPGLPASAAGVGWGLRDAARALGVSVETLVEKYHKAPPPAGPAPYADPDRPGVWRVPLSGAEAAGREAVVDAGTVPLIEGGKFYLAQTGAKGPRRGPTSVYVSASLPGGTYMPLRRIVMGLAVTDRGVRVKHVNDDPLDCRRENLVVRAVERRVEHPGRNGRKCQRTDGRACTSRFKGVCWDKQFKKWVALITVDGKRRNLGRFYGEIAAARAYDAAARELFGEHARLNFPDGVDAFLSRETRDETRQAA
jgi:hypothetical protein